MIRRIAAVLLIGMCAKAGELKLEQRMMFGTDYPTEMFETNLSLDGHHMRMSLGLDLPYGFYGALQSFYPPEQKDIFNVLIGWQHSW